MVVDLAVPTGPTDLTAQWMTAALRASGAIEQSTVTRVEQERIAVGAGFAGQLARITLQYDRPEDGAPATMVGKFPSDHKTTRELMTNLGGYAREVRFYNELADEAGLPAPRCYHAALDAESGHFVILLEDLAPLQVGDQVLGATRDEAEFVVREIARFHARWWNSRQVEETEWLAPSADVATWALSMFESSVEQFRIDVEGERPWLVSMVERVSALLPSMLESSPLVNLPSPFTLVHGDVRMDNIFLPAEPDGPYTVIDWQGVTTGQPAYELAYWLVLSLPVELRREAEEEMLRLYHSTLVEHGVEGYSLRRLRSHYRNSMLQFLAGIVILVGALDFSSPRGQALAAAAMERLEAALRDHKAERTLRIAPWALRGLRLWRRVRHPFQRSEPAASS